VSYTNTDGINFTIRYFNLTSRVDATVPIANDGSLDFLSDVRGTTIVFARSGSQARIFAFDTAVGGQPIEIAPLAPGALFPERFSAAIGDQTIAWQEVSNAPFGGGCCAATIVAYDRHTGTTSVVPPTSGPGFNENPTISPDGSVVVWEGCATTTLSSCLIWKAVRSSAGTWTSQQPVSQLQGPLGRRGDTDGTVIAYSANFANPSGVVADRIVWQPVAGGTEQVLDIPGSSIDPSVSG
jgi:hypothetical protein